MLHSLRVHHTHSGTRKHDVQSGYLRCEELLCMYMCCADWVKCLCVCVCVWGHSERCVGEDVESVSSCSFWSEMSAVYTQLRAYV